MKILIAADGSSYTKRMLAYLAAHDEWLGGGRHQYTVLNTVSPVPARAAAVIDRDTLKSYYADDQRSGVQADPQLLQEAGHRGRVRRQGRPRAGDHRQDGRQGQDFDLLMMGSHGHGTLGNLVMGSVATKVLAACKTPVLLVR